MVAFSKIGTKTVIERLRFLISVKSVVNSFTNIWRRRYCCEIGNGWNQHFSKQEAKIRSRESFAAPILRQLCWAQCGHILICTMFPICISAISAWFSSSVRL